MAWHIRKEDGEEFGPVSLEELQTWTAEGRVSPSDSVSQNRDDWIYAANVDALHMEWVLELEDGTEFGPLHAQSVRQMVEDGEVRPDTPVVHRDRSDRLTAWELTLSAAQRVIHRREASLEALTGELSRTEQRLETLQGTLEETQSEVRSLKSSAEQKEAEQTEALQNLESQREELQKDLEAARKELEAKPEEPAAPPTAPMKETGRWEHLYRETREKAEQEQQEAKKKIRELQNQRLDLQRENERLKAHSELVDQRLNVLQTEGGSEAEQLNALMESNQELARNYDELMTQIESKNHEIAALAESRKEAEESAEARVQSMSERLAREQQEADAARARFKEMEESHMQLVKVYRELNDRYIRLRKDIGSSSPSADTAVSPEKKKSRIRLT